jgi:hypothetical protein
MSMTISGISEDQRHHHDQSLGIICLTVGIGSSCCLARNILHGSGAFVLGQIGSRGAMASEAFVENIMTKMNETNMAAIAKMLELLNQKGSSGGMVDNRGVGRPISFKGDVNKFAEWVAELHAYVRSSNPLASKWLEEASVATETIDDSIYGGNVQDFAIKLHATMISCAEGTPSRSLIRSRVGSRHSDC